MDHLDPGYHNMVDIDWSPYELWMKIRNRFLGDHQTKISLHKLEKVRGKDLVDYANTVNLSHFSSSIPVLRVIVSEPPNKN